MNFDSNANEFWMMQFTLYEYIRYSNSMQDSFAERELRSQIYFFPNMNVIKLQSVHKRFV